MSAFDKALRHLLGIEGDYSDNPDDSGGKTRWGVTEFLARAHGYQGDMREYPVEEAIRVYRVEFWDRLRLDEVAELSYDIAQEMFDTEVNTPIGTAVVFLQRVLNAMNLQGRLFPDLKVDGRIGPATIGALRTFIWKRGKDGEIALLKALNGLQVCYYTELVERRQKDETFYFGWILRRT